MRHYRLYARRTVHTATLADEREEANRALDEARAREQTLEERIAEVDKEKTERYDKCIRASTNFFYFVVRQSSKECAPSATR